MMAPIASAALSPAIAAIWARTCNEVSPSDPELVPGYLLSLGIQDETKSAQHSPPRRGGVAAPLTNAAEPPKRRRRGGAKREPDGEASIKDRHGRVFAELTTRPLQLRWLREILLVSRPPLLCEEGNAHAQGSSHTDSTSARANDKCDIGSVSCPAYRSKLTG